MASPDPKKEKQAQKKERDEEPETLSEKRNRTLPKRVDEFPELKDFYNSFDKLDVTDADGRFFFYSRDRRAYGSVRVWINLSYDYSEQEYTLPLEMRLDAYVNHAGSRVLLTHKVPYR